MELVVKKGSTTAPLVKPSAQSRLVLEAMAVEAKQGEVRWEKMMNTLETLMAKLTGNTEKEGSHQEEKMETMNQELVEGSCNHTCPSSVSKVWWGGSRAMGDQV